MTGHFARANCLRKPVFFAALTVVYILAVIPTETLPNAILRINDKVIHSLTFMVLFFLMDMAYAEMPLGTMAVYLMGYGLFIEVTQFFIPYREFSLLDMLANAVGLCLYFILRQRSVSFYKAWKAGERK